MPRRASAVATLLVLAACSKGTTTGISGSPTPTTSRSVVSGPQVHATDSRSFDPASLSITAGQSVTFVNTGTLPHTVTFDNGPAYDESLEPGVNKGRTFSSAGTFKYHCTIHGASMSGTIIVK